MLNTVQDRREHPRLNSPTLTVHFDGTTYETDDWSLGGVRIRDYDGIRTLGALVTIGALGEVDGEPENVEIRARVVRVDSDGDALCLNYLNMDSAAYGLLSHLASRHAPDLRHAS